MVDFEMYLQGTPGDGSRKQGPFGRGLPCGDRFNGRAYASHMFDSSGYPLTLAGRAPERAC